MPILRLAYTTLFLIALLAVFELWSQVGGQTHLDLIPWYIKLVLGMGAAFATVKAAAAAVGGEKAWNRRTLRWTVILALLLVCCGLASYYAHLYSEDDDDNDDQPEQSVSRVVTVNPAVPDPALGLTVPLTLSPPYSVRTAARRSVSC
jgi:predicted permease